MGTRYTGKAALRSEQWDKASLATAKAKAEYHSRRKEEM